MTSTYSSLHDNYVSNKGRRTSCVTLAVVLGSLTVLGIILAIVVLERPPAPEGHESLDFDEDNFTQCRMSLVESIPEYLKYKDNATFGIPLEQVWTDLISAAAKQVDVVSFYWTLTGEDINVNTSSDVFGKEILKRLGELPSRNVSVRLVSSVPTVRTNSTDLKILKQKGAQVRKVNFGRLTHGVLHSKFWIVDRKHVFIGSANMDWRALTQVKELGVVVSNCSRLANDLHKVFQAYWLMGHPNSSLPHPWPAKFDTDINKQHPLLVEEDQTTSSLYMAGSPPPFCPQSRTQDLEAILSSISEAEEFIDVAVMEYFPATCFEKPRKYWPIIDDALRTSAFERKVEIRMLISCGQSSDPAMLPFLQSLASMNYPEHHISIQIKLYIIPVGNQTEVPFTRINHNKYMVTDKTAYIGTSNWAGDYFLTTAGVSLVVSQPTSQSAWNTKTLRSQLKETFNRDWHSEYAMHLNESRPNPDCTLLR